MWIEKLSLSHFRNIKSLSLEPSDRINLISGANAQGKTSIIEAIYLSSTGRLLRGSQANLAISHGEQSSQVRLFMHETKTELGMDLELGKNKKALLNGVKLPRASDLIGRLPLVCFWSGDLAISQGDPSERRGFMDMELSQLYPAYLKALTVYKRALTQRNALIKSVRESGGRFAMVEDGEFEVWEVQLVSAGNQLKKHRQDWIDMILPLAKDAHHQLASHEDFELEIEAVTDELSEEIYAEKRGKDLARGSTSIGPHRDDLVLKINGQSVRSFGSQGQQRSSVISLKLAVLEVARQHLGFPPVLLLDDIFSDLDSNRRKHLVERSLELGGQVFVTCTEPEQAGEKFALQSRVFLVESGQVKKK